MTHAWKPFTSVPEEAIMDHATKIKGLQSGHKWGQVIWIWKI